MVSDAVNQDSETFAVAIIGLAGRFPGAQNIAEFWSNLRDGVESITFASDEELQQEIKNSAILRDPSIVKASSRLTDIDLFDASFFGYSPKEADMMDPQHRLFLQCAWEALEHAGYDPAIYPGLIGMYGGVGTNMYIKDLLLANNSASDLDGLQLTVGNDKDYLTTRVSYKLNLRGPSIGIQTACSTSLVAVHLASQALLDFECDMALAGGVSVRAPQPMMYRYAEGSILSPDGHCRAFDEQGQGTIFGNGLGLVVLKRLDDALHDGDTIYAVIKGSAINNDGSDKIGYTAPGTQGQRKAIQQAIDAAQVDPATISYIEAHGTGTALGDPIEFSALKHIFASVKEQHACALGSVKTNIGHLDTAAGISGLIKTTLALQHKQIPPTLHFQRPNPQIDLEHSPFYINQSLTSWPASKDHPRRAGVSSFGIGGTNAHVVLEEAPVSKPQASTRTHHLLLLSAQTPEALERASTNMQTHLREHPEQALADIAYTSQVGRHAFTYRRALVCNDLSDAQAALTTPAVPPVLTGEIQPLKPYICFLFPGQGAQYSNMAHDLYQNEPVFRESVDRCSSLYMRYSASTINIRELLYPSPERVAETQEQLYSTQFTQPALFIIEYALAQLLLDRGIQPAAMIGHSIGEYVAASLAGVLSLEDALLLVTRRGELMQQCQPGDMLSIALSEDLVREYLNEQISLASINGPDMVVVAGSAEAIEALQSRLIRRDVHSHKLHTSHAFHSWMMDEITERFASEVRKVKLNPPRIPYISNVTGSWIQDTEATDPAYWVRQLRATVRLQSGLQTLLANPNPLLIEVGPGQTLNKIVRQQATATRDMIIVPTLQENDGQQPDSAFLLTTLARLWLVGLPIAWQKMYAAELRQRIALPTYPFAREHHWLNIPASKQAHGQLTNETGLATSLWQQSISPPQDLSATTETQHVLAFLNESVLGEVDIAAHLGNAHYIVTCVRPGKSFTKVDERTYVIDPGNHEDYDRLLQEVLHQSPRIHKVLHMWNALPDDDWQPDVEALFPEYTFYTVLYLLQALSHSQQLEDLHLLLVTTNLNSISGEEPLQPQKALLLGPAKVVALEHPGVRCQLIDISYPRTMGQARRVLDQLLAEMGSSEIATPVAYRGTHRWRQTFAAISSQHLAAQSTLPTFRQGGTYLITGGLGGIGLGLAEQLARDYQAQLVLLSRTALPEQDEWIDWLANHDEKDRTSQRIRQLQRIEEHGGKTLILAADVTDPLQMQAAVEQTMAHFGTLHGVLHLAGVPGSGLIQLKTPEVADVVFAPKVTGTLNLAQAVRERELDFFILFSSFTTITGGIGQVDYIAANAFLAAFAQYQQTTTGVRTIAIDWDAWQWDSWQSAEMQIMPELQSQIRQMRTEKGITFPQGLAYLRQILRLPCSQVIVSAQDIPTSIENHLQFARTFWTQQITQANVARKAATSTSSTYVAPRNEIEEILVGLWQDALGIEQIGIYDHFIELGGHSLMVVQLLWKIREAFHTNLPMKTLFAEDTVAGLAKAIADQLNPQYDDDNLESLLQEIEGLSEEEVELLLIEEEQRK